MIKLLVSSNICKYVIVVRGLCSINESKLCHLAKAYKPKEIEINSNSALNSLLISNEVKSERSKFSILLPPPNVTGKLHLGHAFMAIIQDAICRHKFQEGYNVYWIPGTDHAGIATQVVVEKYLAKKRRKSRYDLGQSKFVEEVLCWKEQNEKQIMAILKRLNCSLNWEHKYFTMDKDLKQATKEAFVYLYDIGLLERKKSLVNWSCALESAISDIEVENMEINGPTSLNLPGYDEPIEFGRLYDIAYKYCNYPGEIIVSTTRPETLLGDVAIAVHPEDERYSFVHEKLITVMHPFRNVPIPVVLDYSVDPQCGTGALKITPAHDKNDFQIAKRHSLSSVQVITSKGTICNEFNDFAGLPRFTARKLILDRLSLSKLYKGNRPHTMILPICSRSGDIVEYLTKDQWFLDCKEMAESAINAVKNGEIKIHPKKYEKEWFKWLNECKEWCISRQIWWGIEIPAYECSYDRNKKWVAALTEEEALSKSSKQFGWPKNKISIIHDNDVLDTWFSSSLLPFSALGWPNKNYKDIYPLDLMETGHDILFFWVARMVMLGHKLTGEYPFRNILLNGILCDIYGRKMSKSRGNVILPEQVIYGASLDELENELNDSLENGILSNEEYKKSLKGVQKSFPNGIPECGTDALRFTVCSYNIKNAFINFDVNECYTNKLFFNKIWQAARYTLMSCEKLKFDVFKCNMNDIVLGELDKWILSRLGSTRQICNQSFINYDFHFGTNALKMFFYSNFCDVYLESTKPEMVKKTENAKAHCFVLSVCLSLGLKAMMPFTPFISNELLKYFPSFESIIDIKYIDKSIEEEVKSILDVCFAIRQFKSSKTITKKYQPCLHLFPQSDEALKVLSKYKKDIQTLTMCNEVILENNFNKNRKNEFDNLSIANHLCSFAISTQTEVLVKTDAVLNTKKFEKLQNDLNKLLNTVSVTGYQKAASQDVKNRHKKKIKELQIEIESLKSIVKN